LQIEGRMNEKWWRMNEEWWMKNDEGWMKNDEGWMKNDEGWVKKDEGWMKNDEGWWFQAVEGFCRLTDERTDICEYRVAFATEKFGDPRTMPRTQR